jgi:surfeit locus 1 family protein
MKRLRTQVVYWAGRWHPGLRMSAFVLVMLPLVIALGVWQLERADEKRWYQTRQLERMSLSPQAPPEAVDAESAFLRITVEGAYRPGRDYLVDNRVHGGRPGYWIISEFVANDGRVWLVNRGWLAGPASRDHLPLVPTPEGELRLVGVLWPDTGMPPLLAADPWPTDWPKRVQRLDIGRMAEEPGVVRAELRLEPDGPGAFVPAPLDVAFSPAVHQGYALQWFGLGLALVTGYVIFGFKRLE